MNSRLSHTDERGHARMVDVGKKPIVARKALAAGFIRLQPDTLALIKENGIQKGDVLATARLAGIMGAKHTSTLIPLCHPLALDQVTVECRIEAEGVVIHASAACHGRTGVEMEALTAVAVTALTIYDMCKAVDKQMNIESIRLLEKRKDDISG